MSTRILVAYASLRGSTAEIAQAVGKELQSAGYGVDVVEMRSVSSLESYHAVVVGGPFYMGRIGDMGKFVARHRDKLKTLPFAAFGVGVAPVEKKPGAVDNELTILHKTLSPLEPVAETIFAGKIDLEKLSFLQKWMVGKVKSPVGDFRDWDTIASWAKELPGKMGI
jgi:menaquinone-dependent protoporphyrinogen oxidase